MIFLAHAHHANTIAPHALQQLFVRRVTRQQTESSILRPESARARLVTLTLDLKSAKSVHMHVRIA